MQKHTDIYAWRVGHALMVELYKVARDLPSYELYGMAAQLRRAAQSITNNIVEGSVRTGWADYARSLNIAEASAAEVSNILIGARDVGYLDARVADPLIAKANEVGRLIYRLRRAVETKRSNSPR